MISYGSETGKKLISTLNNNETIALMIGNWKLYEKLILYSSGIIQWVQRQNLIA